MDTTRLAQVDLSETGFNCTRPNEAAIRQCAFLAKKLIELLPGRSECAGRDYLIQMIVVCCHFSLRRSYLQRVNGSIFIYTTGCNFVECTKVSLEDKMLVQEYTRRGGQRLTYTIVYGQGEYFIQRDGLMKKSVPDAIVASVTPHEATADLMLRMAIADIESLIGMEE